LLRADGWLLRLDQLLVVVAAAAVFVMMVVTAADVVMRYAFNSPLSWAFDLTTHYLLLTAFAFGFSYTLRINHHISVDFFARRLPDQTYHLAQAIGCILAAALFANIAWISGHQAYDAWAQGEVIFGALIWPTWPQKAIIPVTLCALSLRTIHRGFAHWAAQRDVDLQRKFEIGTEFIPMPEE
jgi:TRAP-type C4-dicarboxylate transport system permease small subunit